MTRAYLGFAADLRRLLTKMRGLREEYGDEWQAAAALIPTIDVKVRDQLATEHLVHCWNIDTGGAEPEPHLLGTDGSVPDALPPLPPGRKRRDSAGKQLLRQLGVSAGDVKAWAISQGLLAEIKRGQPGMDLIELYAVAHEDPVYVRREDPDEVSVGG
jgi:hypothetical protein